MNSVLHVYQTNLGAEQMVSWSIKQLNQSGPQEGSLTAGLAAGIEDRPRDQRKVHVRSGKVYSTIHW